MSVTAADNVQIDVQLVSRVGSVANFGVPCFFALDSAFSTTPTKYTSVSALPVGASALVVNAVTKAFGAGSPKLNAVYVARRLANVAQISTVTFSAATATKVYQVHVTIDADADGVSVTYDGAYTSDGTPTFAEIYTGLASDLNNKFPANTVLAANTGDAALTLTAEVAGVGFSFTAEVDDVGITVTTATTTANVSGGTQIATLAQTVGWYTLIPLGASNNYVPKIDILQMAHAIEALPVGYERIGAYQSNEAAINDANDTTDVVSILNGLSYSRAFVLYESRDVAVLAANMGRWLAFGFEAALASPYNIALSGVSPDTVLVKADRDAVTGKHGNIFMDVLGVDGGCVFYGHMTSGLEARIRRGIDWFVDQMRTQIASYLRARADRGLPTLIVQPDIDAIGGLITSLCDKAFKIGLFQSMPVVGVPRVQDLDPDQTALGILSGYTINGVRAPQVEQLFVTAYIS